MPIIIWQITITQTVCQMNQVHFAETNDNGVWVPKQYTGSHGSYGHYLKFEQFWMGVQEQQQ